MNDAIARESHFTTKYLGKPKLKGVGQSVEVYCINSHGLPETNMEVSAKLRKAQPLCCLCRLSIVPFHIFIFIFNKTGKCRINCGIVYGCWK